MSSKSSAPRLPSSRPTLRKSPTPYRRQQHRLATPASSYLVWVLARFDERDQTLLELLASRQSSANGAVAASARHLASLIGRSGTSREALSRLEAALGASESAAHAGWQEFVGFFNSAWVPRRAALEGALAEHLSMADLRTVSAIDADSMLEERNLYTRAVAPRS